MKIIERRHYIFAGIIIAVAFALQPFALLGAQIFLAPKLVPMLTGQNQDGSPILAGKEIDATGLKIRGDANAEIILVEFSDYQCPFCARFHDTPKNIVAASGGKVAWAWKHFPLSFHPEATPSAIAAECVYKLGGNDKFWTFSDLLIANQQTLSASLYKSEAGKLGINAAQFETCLKDPAMAKIVTEETNLGSSLGVNGTPNTLITKKVGDKLEILESINGALPEETVLGMLAEYMK